MRTFWNDNGCHNVRVWQIRYSEKGGSYNALRAVRPKVVNGEKDVVDSSWLRLAVREIQSLWFFRSFFFHRDKISVYSDPAKESRERKQRLEIEVKNNLIHEKIKVSQ